MRSSQCDIDGRPLGMASRQGPATESNSTAQAIWWSSGGLSSRPTRSSATPFRPFMSTTFRTKSCPKKLIIASALRRCEAAASSAPSSSPEASSGGLDFRRVPHCRVRAPKSSPLNVFGAPAPFASSPSSPFSPSSTSSGGSSGHRAFSATTTSAHSLNCPGCSSALEVMMSMAFFSSPGRRISTARKRSSAREGSGLAPAAQSSLSSMRTVHPDIVSFGGQTTTCSTSSSPKPESSVRLVTADLPARRPTHSGLTPSSSARRAR
mmetsp:Transcript_107356/g.334626  ORF Transcript_107356/g.334626 Transcript_107356/m.334626 type:complete len:265 (+) Transcript_107356:137-931(+)